LIYLETRQEIHQQQAQAYYQALVEYAKTLKQGHNALKKEASDLLRMLRKHGVLSEAGIVS